MCCQHINVTLRAERDTVSKIPPKVHARVSDGGFKGLCSSNREKQKL